MRRIARDVQRKRGYNIAKTSSIHPLTLRHWGQHILRTTSHALDIQHGTTLSQRHPQLRIKQIHNPRTRLVRNPEAKGLVLQFPPVCRDRHVFGVDVEFAVDGRAVRHGCGSFRGAFAGGAEIGVAGGVGVGEPGGYFGAARARVLLEPNGYASVGTW